MSRYVYLTLYAGLKYEFFITPTVLASDGIEDLPLEDRQCKYKKEIDGPQNSLFASYTSKSCLTECMMKYAAERAGGCAPIDFPLYHPERNKR